MKKDYMIEMWDNDGKGIDVKGDQWYYATPKEAEAFARTYLTNNAGGVFIVIKVFNGGHYRTVRKGIVDIRELNHVA